MRTIWWTRSGWIALVAGLSIVAVASWGASDRPAERGASAAAGDERGPAIPDFQLASLDGRRLGPAQLRGKVVLYDFWATWCTPCHVQAEILDRLYQQERTQGVEFVAISSGEPAETVHKYVAKRPFPYTVLLDEEDSLSGPLDIEALPTLIVVDAQGNVVWRHTGLADSGTLHDVLVKAGAAAGI
jgi:cytochrome c biogenesis protein CcmG/thiol:disulfide interchange protein DsbE